MSAKALKKRSRLVKKSPLTKKEKVVRFKPLPQQVRGIKFLVSRAVAGLFLDPGLGKTMCVYAAFDLIRQKTALDLLLVVAPLRPVRRVWPDEAKKWKLPHKVGVLRGKDRLATLMDPSHDVLVINFEALEWLYETVSRDKVLLRRFKSAMLVIDESSKVKNGRTLRFKILKQMLGWFMRRVILTGTPSPNGLMDLWSQIYLLDMGGALGRFITNYRRAYFSPTGYMGYDWTLNDGADELIYAKLRQLVLRIDRSEIKGMPKLKTVDIPVPMPDEARDIYTQMYMDFAAKIQRHEVTSKNAAVSSMKCRQICSGALYTDSAKRKVLEIHTAKLDALCDLVDELNGKPVLIAVEFQHEVDRIRKALGKRGGKVIPALVGGVNDAEADRIIDQWNAGELPVLLGNPQTIAHGLNLQGASSTIIWYTVPWNLEWYLQFIDRLRRTGQKAKRVMNYRLIMEETVDEVVAKVVDEKDATQSRLLKALVAYVHKRRTK